MKWLIVENEIINNVIEADESYAAAAGALPYYPGADIGGAYAPPGPPPTEIEILQAQTAALQAQLAQSDEAALDLFEAQAAQAEISTQQDEAIIDLYTRVGG